MPSPSPLAAPTSAPLGTQSLQVDRALLSVQKRTRHWRAAGLWHGVGGPSDSCDAPSCRPSATPALVNHSVLPRLMRAMALAPDAIPHVCVAGEQQTVGSFEYLVYSSTLVGVAAQFGLKPVLDYKHGTLAALFEEVCAFVWSGRGWG